MCEAKSKNKSNKKFFFSGPACKNESIIVKTRSSKNFSRIFKKNQLKSKKRSRNFFFGFDLYKCVNQNQKINRAMFFWEGFVKVSSSLSKGKSSKVSFCGICKINQPLSKIRPRTFFLVRLRQVCQPKSKKSRSRKK